MIPINNILNPGVLQMLGIVDKTMQALGFDFYLVGAIARDYHLSKLNGYTPKRKTLDVDIAVLVANEEQFIQLKESLINTGKFIEHSEPIKLLYKDEFEIELDLLPFGEIENNGVTILTKPRTFTLDMPGFDLLNAHTGIFEINPNLKLQVCPIEGVIMLKLFAWDDRQQRTKDLIDIQHIIQNYFDLSSDIIYEEHYDLLRFSFL